MMTSDTNDNSNNCMVLDSDNIAAFDVDDTIIIWKHNPSPKELALLERSGAIIDINGVKAYRNDNIILEIKRHKARGHTVILWSQGGFVWAARAVKILGIEAYVDIAMSKPKWLWDDKQPNDWCDVYYKELFPIMGA